MYEPTHQNLGASLNIAIFVIVGDSSRILILAIWKLASTITYFPIGQLGTRYNTHFLTI